MSRRAGALSLLLVCSCSSTSASDAGMPVTDCTSKSVATSDGPVLTGIEPRVLTRLTPSMTVSFTGDPAWFAQNSTDVRFPILELNDAFVGSVTSATAQSFTVPLAVTGRERPFDLTLAIWDYGAFPPVTKTVISQLRCAGVVQALPGSLDVTVSSEQLKIPLVAGLSGRCARRANLALENPGDLPVTISAVQLEPSDGFSVTRDSCSGATLQRSLDGNTDGARCGIELCFESTVAGPHHGVVRIDSSVEQQTATFEATVTPSWQGLDTGFFDGGMRLLHQQATGFRQDDDAPRLAAIVGDGIAVISSSFYIAARELGLAMPDGGFASKYNAYPELGGALAYLDVSALGSREGRLFVLGRAQDNTRSVLVRLHDDLTVDTSFGTGGAVMLDESIFVPRFFAISPQRTYVAGSEVMALDVNGRRITGFGVNGVLPYLRLSGYLAADGRDRLWLSTDGELRRYDASGALDAVVLSSLMNFALDSSGGVVASSGSTVVDGGDVALTTAPGTDFAVDALGRVHWVAEEKVYRRELAGAATTEWPLPGASLVRCPPQGGCYVAGKTGLETYVVRLRP